MFVNISKKFLLSVAFLPFVSACADELDMQGVAPRGYYETNPIENKVEIRSDSFAVKFYGNSKNPTADSASEVRAVLADISPRAIESGVLRFNPKLSYRDERLKYVNGLLAASGHKTINKLRTDKDAPSDEILIDITRAAVISPDCPDWRKSPVTTFSNTVPSNFGCAAAVNLGLMLDDPRDLVRGRDSKIADAERGAKALQDYREGKSAAASGGSSSASSASAGGQ